MKKLFVIAFTMLLGASLAFAQAGGGSTDKPTTATKGKKHHKGGKKHKKGDSANTGTTTPK